MDQPPFGERKGDPFQRKLTARLNVKVNCSLLTGIYRTSLGIQLIVHPHVYFKTKAKQVSNEIQFLCYSIIIFVNTSHQFYPKSDQNSIKTKTLIKKLNRNPNIKYRTL